MNKKADERREIKENIKWFSKFSLEKRLEIAELDTKTTKILKGLQIIRYAKPKRAG